MWIHWWITEWKHIQIDVEVDGVITATQLFDYNVLQIEIVNSF